MPANQQDSPYFFCYFTHNGEDGLHLAASDDGYAFRPLAGGKSLLAPTVGESKLMRDPHIARGPDGTFHMVWTTSWTGCTIGYARSKDLVTWSDQRALPVMDHEPTTRNCWAPELAYDETAKRWTIFWASTIPGRFPTTQVAGDAGYNHRMYATTTADFESFDDVKLFYDPGFNVIDATLFRDDDGTFLWVVKDETREPKAKKHLRWCRAESANGPFGELSAPFTRDWVEGPTLARVGEHVVCYYDCYADHHYGAVRTKDFKTWEDVTQLLHMPRGARHGSIFRAERALLEKIS